MCRYLTSKGPISQVEFFLILQINLKSKTKSFKNLTAAVFWKGKSFQATLLVARRQDFLYIPGILRIKYCVKQNCQLIRNFAVKKAVLIFTFCLQIALTVNKP